jgi:ketosteroid isomerase-like protein
MHLLNDAVFVISDNGEPLMKTKLLLAVVVAVGFLLLPSAVKTQSNAEKEVRDLEQKMNAAYATNDLSTYFAYYSQDLTQWLPEGRTDLPEYEKMWTGYVKNVARVESVELSDVHVQVGPSGDAAVVSYLLHVKSRSVKGEITEEDNQESDVLFKRDGAWKVVFLHYSAAPKKKK